MSDLNGQRSNLPPEWEWTTLGEIADCRLGKMLDKQKNLGELRPYLRNINVQWHRFELADVKKMRITDAEVERYSVRAGDLLVCEGGEPGRCAVWREGREMFFQKALHRVRPHETVLPEYLAHYLRHAAASGVLEQLFTGTTIRHLPGVKLAQIPVPVPPLEEQSRIVGVMESYLAALGQITAELDEAQRELTRFVSAALAVGAFGQPVAGGSAGVQPSLPDGWVWSSVGKEGAVQLGRQRAPKYHTGPNMRPYLRVANVFEDRLDLDDVMKMDFSDSDFERFQLIAGDILLNEGQSPELVGRPAIYRGELPGACFTNTLIRFRSSDRVSPEYALLVFRHYMRSGRFRQEARITTNIAHLSAGRLARVEFPVPPIDEQMRLVADAHRLIEKAAALEGAISDVQRRGEVLRRAIARDAFAGRRAVPRRQVVYGAEVKL